VPGRLPFEFDSLGEQTLKGFDQPVRAFVVQLKPGEQIPESESSAVTPEIGTNDAHDRPLLELPDKPSIVVLPFTNMSSDPEQEYFSDGITEDIITTLSKLSGLFVIARNSSFAYKDQVHGLRQVAAELGVRFILEGSIRTAANRMRISVQLIDATDGGHVWAERYDRTIDDVFAIQDEITLKIATELQVKLTEGEQAHIRYTTTSNVQAWNNWIQGLAYFRSEVSTGGVGRAREFWEKALAFDPRSATLNAMLGFIHWASARYGWWEDRETARARAEGYVTTAIAMDNENADAHTVRALLLIMTARHNEAVGEARRAIDLGPGSADIAAFTSLVFNFSGLADEALAQITKAMRLSPIYPSWYLGDLGFANRLLGRYDEAIRAFKEYGERSPGFGHIDLVIIYSDLGRKEESEAEAVRLSAARPSFTITSWRRTQFYKNPVRLEADVEALREAGLPE
jgi:adenylate cyclase